LLAIASLTPTACPAVEKTLLAIVGMGKPLVACDRVFDYSSIVLLAFNA
jgi:hypothetical protein